MPLEIPEDLQEQVPDAIQKTFKENVDGAADIRIAIASDMNLDGEFRESWLLANNKWVVSINPNHSKKPDVLKIPASKIVSMKTKNFIGNGILEVHTSDNAVQLLRYSKTMSAKVGDAAHAIEELLGKESSEGKRGRGPGPRKRKGRCEECGRALPHWSETCPHCLKKGRAMLRLLKYLKPYWYLAVIALIVTLVTSGLSYLPVYINKPLMDRVLAPVDDLPAEALTSGARLRMLNLIILALIGLHIVNTGLGAGRSFLMSWLSYRVIFDLRTQAYEYLQKLSLSFYNKNETGRLIARISEDTSRLQWFITESIREVVQDIFWILYMGTFLFLMDWKLAAITLIPLPALTIGTAYFGRRMHRLYHRLWRRMSTITAILADTIPGVKVVKAFAAERREVDRFNAASKDVFDYGVRAAKLNMAYYPLMGFATFAGGIVVRWFGGQSIIGGTLTLGTYMVFIASMMRFYGPIRSLTRVNERVQRAASSAERVFEILDATPEIADKKNSVDLGAIKGSIRFENVTFSYDGEKNALENISFEVKPGEMIGLSGPSGAGKSTLVSLVCRFYDVTDGAIYMDGHDLRDIKMDSMREQIGVVLQEPFLFHGSVAENIAYGRPKAKMEEIMAAAKAANAHDFIVEFPDGYDSQVGERGVKLSGGERQRISIARAILKNPRILILDEATSSVDTETESTIQEAVERLIQGRTTFAIAHRLSTLRRADRLLILDNGNIDDMGTHQELLERGGLYQRLVNMQSELSKIVAIAG